MYIIYISKNGLNPRNGSTDNAIIPFTTVKTLKHLKASFKSSALF